MLKVFCEDMDLKADLTDDKENLEVDELKVPAEPAMQFNHTYKDITFR